METVALRFSNVYGPRSFRKGSVIARFIKRALKGRALEIYGDGSQTRDFLFVDDLVRAVVSAAREPSLGGEVFQVASGCETSVEELLALLAPLLEQRAGLSVEMFHGPERPGEITRSFADISKAQNLLGWNPETPLSKGLEQTVDWFVEQWR